MVKQDAIMARVPLVHGPQNQVKLLVLYAKLDAFRLLAQTTNICLMLDRLHI